MRCKNCNVKLAAYLEKCPLCGEKINTSITSDNPYNLGVEKVPKRVNVLYFSRIILEILVLGTIITVLINFLVNKQISWSLYVVASTIYVSSFYSFIVLKNKKWSLLINIICLELLLFAISYLTNSTPWFFYIVGPIILLFTIFVYLNLILSEYTNILRSFSILLVYIAISLVIINGLIKIYKIGAFLITWSKYSSIVILIISVFCLIISFNKKVQNEMEKRFFI